MKFFVNQNDIVHEFWSRKAYNPAPYPEFKSFFFTEEEEANNFDGLLLFNHLLDLAQRDGYLVYSSHEYTNPDGSPMKIYSLTPLGRELGKRLVERKDYV
ncbi:hypothetical protein [Chitinophaga rhizophila]|uniref:Uncharacterized protein n=1 Tax=Chitinophaga rhizophila TaxID=2866212 RepID=A0ABS7GAS2_9BACT|nr:hypothetical protein [Chitinophaga rhizophila]MBW8684769.1 hypothetical protein [Chitinophaga rhizophila]